MSECCVVQIPGPRGATGADGEDGVDGINAFTLTTLEFTVPPVGDPVDVFVVEESWASPNGSAVNGQVVHVQFAGYFYVESAPDGGPMTLVNLGYDGNAAPGTIIPPSSKVSPAGPRGPSGAEVSGVLLAVNNLSDVDDIATALGNLGIGTAGLEDKGNALNEIPFVNDPAGLTNGESVWATAFGLETVNASDARTRLGLVIGRADTNIPPVNIAAGLIDTEPVFATATGLRTLAPAAARASLGINTGLAFKANKNGISAAIAATRVTFVELFDPEGVYTDATDRYIPGVSGAVVQIDCTVNIQSAGTAVATLYLYKNGVSIAETHGAINATSETVLSLNVSDLVGAPGDYYEIFAGTSLVVGAVIDGDITKTWFEGHRIA